MQVLTATQDEHTLTTYARNWLRHNLGCDRATIAKCGVKPLAAARRVCMSGTGHIYQDTSLTQPNALRVRFVLKFAW